MICKKCRQPIEFVSFSAAKTGLCDECREASD